MEVSELIAAFEELLALHRKALISEGLGLASSEADRHAFEDARALFVSELETSMLPEAVLSA